MRGSFVSCVSQVELHPESDGFRSIDGVKFDSAYMTPYVMSLISSIRKKLIADLPEAVHRWCYHEASRSFMLTKDNFIVQKSFGLPSGCFTTHSDDDLGHKLWIIASAIRLGVDDPLRFFVNSSDDAITGLPYIVHKIIPLPHTVDGPYSTVWGTNFLGKEFREIHPSVYVPVPFHFGKFAAAFPWVSGSKGVPDLHACYQKVLAAYDNWFYSLCVDKDGVLVIDKIRKLLLVFIHQLGMNPKLVKSSTRLFRFWTGIEIHSSYLQTRRRKAEVLSILPMSKDKKKVEEKVTIKVEPKTAKKRNVSSGVAHVNAGPGNGLADRLALQMLNPEETTRGPGSIIGVPDAAGISDETHLITTITDIPLDVDPTSGEFSAIAAPHALGHLAVSGASGGTTAHTGTGTSVQAASMYVPSDTPGATNIRDEGAEGKSKTYVTNPSGFLTLGGPHGSNVSAATFPFRLKNEDSSYIVETKRYGATVTGLHHAFVADISKSPIKSAGVNTLLEAFFFQVASTANTYLLQLFGSSSFPNFTSDTLLAEIGNGTGSNYGGSYGAVDFSSYNFIYLVLGKTAGIYSTDLWSYKLRLDGFTALPSSTSQSGTGAAFVYDAEDATDESFRAYRCVSMSMLVQNRSNLLEKGGDIASDVYSGEANLRVDNIVDYNTLAGRAGAYTGNAKDGAYCAWLPRNLVGWKTWHDYKGANVDFRSNVLAIAGRVNDPTEASLHVRVCAVWQVVTENRKFGPERKSFVPPGATDDTICARVFETFNHVPITMCNPSHEQWTAILKEVRRTGAFVIKNLPKMIAAGKMIQSLF
jgi:hypothetical protein